MEQGRAEATHSHNCESWAPGSTQCVFTGPRDEQIPPQRARIQRRSVEGSSRGGVNWKWWERPRFVRNGLWRQCCGEGSNGAGGSQRCSDAALIVQVLILQITRLHYAYPAGAGMPERIVSDAYKHVASL